MGFPVRTRIILGIIISITLTLILAFAIVIGIAIASTYNLTGLDSFNESEASLPTQIFDRHGTLITEFFSNEKRELVSIEEMPRHLVYAVIIREDKNFFKHKGISIRGTLRATIGYLTGNFAGGGSTITQQLATMLYFEKSNISISRKLREMWVALQLERNWSKNEILEEYLNKSWFGHNTYGVEAASQFFFNHSVQELTIAESMMLALQLSSTAKYSPLKNPNLSRTRQWEMLNEMVSYGYATQEDIESSFEEFWQNYDYTRAGTTTAFFEREDRAPYFSEHIRYILSNEILLGSADIYRDGYKVYTTLDLNHQDLGRNYLQEGIAAANRVYQSNISLRLGPAIDTFTPVTRLLFLGFDINQLQEYENNNQRKTKEYFNTNLSPILDLVTLLNGESAVLRDLIAASNEANNTAKKKITVEGALISIENSTGYVLSMIGGNNFEQINQFNRAIDARVQPGSSFKPLYYTAAIEKNVITPATMIYDSPIVFWNDDGTPYTPTNYRGEWHGPVLARYALARSMNVPSLRILNRLGFIDAIDISSQLLNITQKEQISRGLIRKYPIGLGVISVSPIMMATAYATFPNQGRKVTPVFIRYIEDRFGRIIAEPAREIREQQARREEQIISPQTAYIMTDILQTTVSEGTLRYSSGLVNGFDDMPIAGKTGTTQNWSALWTVGFSPYYTTAVWIGFDEGSNSLGVNQSGAITAAPIWAKYMKKAHEDLEPLNFTRPQQGIVEIEVTKQNGLLPPAGYSGDTYIEIFRTGTEPVDFDESDRLQIKMSETGKLKLEKNLFLNTGIKTNLYANTTFPGNDLIDLSNIDLSLNIDDASLELINQETNTNQQDTNIGTNIDTDINFGGFFNNPFINDMDDNNTENPSLIPPEGIIEKTGSSNPYLD